MSSINHVGRGKAKVLPVDSVTHYPLASPSLPPITDLPRDARWAANRDRIASGQIERMGRGRSVLLDGDACGTVVHDRCELRVCDK